jgi:hypothetical protein
VRRHRLEVAAIVAGLATRLVFWAYTGRVWEDALIALTHVRNAVNGIGLTSHPGDGRVEGFSSPIGVLVPLASEVVVRGSGLVALRVAALVAFTVAVLAAAAICRRLGIGTWPTGFVMSYLAFDFLQVFYGMSGMETEVAVAIVLCGTLAGLRGRDRLTGVAMGLAVLARPELAVWALASFVATLRRGGRRALGAAAVALLVALPWFIFALLYYRNPIPLSVRAKSTSYTDFSGLTPGHFDPLHWLGAHLAYHLPMWRLITPFRDDTLIQHAPVPDPLLVALAILLFGLALLGAWRTRGVRGWGPSLFLCAAFAVYRIALLPEDYFDWYWPPVLALFMTLVAAGLDTADGWIRGADAAGRGRARLAVPVVVAGLAVAFALPMIYRLPMERRIQAGIEDGLRRPIGLYLGAAVRSDESVGTEAAGYFGYYSNVRLMDYPGLTSPVAVAILRQAPPEQRDLPYLMNRARPAWLAVRPLDIEAIRREYPDLLSEYRVEREFHVDVSTDQWGLDLANIDRDFVVMRRVASP